MRAIGHYQRLLTQTGLAVCQLEHYDGRAVDAVKLGTYRRAKGLEFKNVFLPQHDTVFAKGTPAETPAGTRGGTETPQTAREREELRRSQLFVAMTRARDLLWLGSVTTGRGSGQDAP
ncbi:3'-5' exonuclease [Streptomyces sp. NPDC087297]|uniref:3'-5' exonuclease n=1 Tax=Streptomyces sp. NPDC087297 TaxID=3365778 RepID=UPI0037F9D40C